MSTSNDHGKGVTKVEYEEPTDERLGGSLQYFDNVDNLSNSDDNGRNTATASKREVKDTNDEAVIAAAAAAAAADTNEEQVMGSTKPTQIQMKVEADAPLKDRLWEVFTTFWSLGFIAFGGPTAHVAILRDHLVIQRNWINDDEFMELFAIGQGLPGPTSTQLVVSCALSRAGPVGGILALLLWNLPGLVVLTICGIVIENYVNPDEAPWYLIGLPPAAIALVFPAFYNFALKIDKLGTVLALVTCLAAILINNDDSISPQSSQFVFPIALVLSGLITYVDSKRAKPFGTYSKPPSPGWEAENEEMTKRIGIPLWVGACIFLVWVIVLVASILLVNVADITNVHLEIFETMYRIGSIIFGGGQVVLPLLQDEVVPSWMTSDQFLQGLGLAQSMPGPLFNFSAYLGAVYQGIPGALIAFVGIFGPGVILIFAAVPFWARLRHNNTFKSILSGLNASAIGLVGAACVTLWESAIQTSADAMVFSVSLTLNTVFAFGAPYCVFIGAIVGAILHPDALDLGQQPYCIRAGFQDLE